MHHTVEVIAKSHFLDADIAKNVAETSKHVIRYGDNVFAVSTWNVNDFVSEVRAAQGDEEANIAIRNREIAKVKTRFETRH